MFSFFRRLFCRDLGSELAAKERTVEALNAVVTHLTEAVAQEREAGVRRLAVVLLSLGGGPYPVSQEIVDAVMDSAVKVDVEHTGDGVVFSLELEEGE